MPRAAGKRESRYAHLFSGEVPIEDNSESMGTATEPPASGSGRIDELAQLVSELRQEIAQLEHRVALLESRGTPDQ